MGDAIIVITMCTGKKENAGYQNRRLILGDQWRVTVESTHSGALITYFLGRAVGQVMNMCTLERCIG